MISNILDTTKKIILVQHVVIQHSALNYQLFNSSKVPFFQAFWLKFLKVNVRKKVQEFED